MIIFYFTIFLFILPPLIKPFAPPTDDVFNALRHICHGQYYGGNCPYAIAYDIATQLAGNWHNGDGAFGIWSDGHNMWWPSGTGLWAMSEFLHAMEGRSTDRLYFSLRWAAIETANNQNNFIKTGYTDDQAWWANGALRLEEYVQKLGDQTPELRKAIQAVINDNTAHETGSCGGGVFWYYGTPPPDNTGKTTISNVLTIYSMATMFKFTHDLTLLEGGERGGAKDIYNWLVKSDLLNPQTGYQRDSMTGDCKLQGGSLDYEYGVLFQALIALADATGNQEYIDHALVYAKNAISQFTKNNIIYEGCDYNNDCAGDFLSFRGQFYLGLGRLYEITKADFIGEVIEASYNAMLGKIKNGKYPLSIIQDNINNYQGDDQNIVCLADLNLATSMIKVHKHKYASDINPQIDDVVNGLLPFDATIKGLTACVCNDFGCPRNHDGQCWSDSGHKNSVDGHHWNGKVSGLLVGPGHGVLLFKANEGGMSDWIRSSQWFVGDEWNDQVDSINIDD